MVSFRDLSIRGKVALVTMLASGTAVLFACLAIFAYETLTFREAMVRALVPQAEIVGTNSASALLFNDARAATETLAALRAEPHVVWGAIYGRDGRLFASYARPDLPSASAVAATVPVVGPGAHAFENDRLVVVRPIGSAGEAIGSVAIQADLNELRQRIRQYAGILFGMSLASLLVALAISAIAQRAISRPVIALAAAAKSVSQHGDTSVRVPPGGKDEVGTLIDAFNRMLEAIQAGERLRKANEQLEAQNRQILEASRLKSEFLANMSHELRTPLNAIIGFAELMHDGRVGPVAANHKEYLGDILTSSRHLLQLINDVLDLSKIEAGKVEIRPEPVSLATLVAEVRDVLRGVAGKKAIRLDVALDPTVDRVEVDPGKLKQVLYNYLSNALKFTPDGGRVTVRALPEGADRFRIEVVDDGIGIRPEELGRLFVEFEQLDSGAAKRFQGTGLGLALTRRIVEAQGGRVGVESTPGRGSTFFAVLPRVGRVGGDGGNGAGSSDGERPALRRTPADPRESIRGG